MPSAVCLPQTASPLDLLVVACETQQPTKISNYHDAPASTSTMSDLTSVTPRTVSPVDEIIVLFGERSNQPTKKRSRQRLSVDKHIDLPPVALEGVRATRALLLAATKLAATTSDPAMDLVVDCLSLRSNRSIVASLPWSWLVWTLLQQSRLPYHFNRRWLVTAGVFE